jgi:hypothetical protein
VDALEASHQRDRAIREIMARLNLTWPDAVKKYEMSKLEPPKPAPAKKAKEPAVQ